jgi:integrase
LSVINYKEPKGNNRGGDLDKQWYVEFYYENPDKRGRLKRKKVYQPLGNYKTFESRSQAMEDLISRIKEELSRGIIPFIMDRASYQRYEWQEEIDEFLKEVKVTRAKSTHHKYKSECTHFMGYLEANKRNTDIASFSLSDAKKFRDYLVHIGRAPGTINGYLVTLERIYREAIQRHGLSLINPFSEISRFPKENAAKQTIKLEDIHKISAYLETEAPDKIKRQNMLLFLRFIFLCFIRPYSELRYMQIKWIDFTNYTVTIPANVAKKVKKTLTVPIPKGALRSQIEYLLEYDPELYVFTVSGLPGKNIIGGNTFKERFEKMLDVLHLNKAYTPYAFKHTGAILLLKNGVNAKQIQLQMRHGSLEMTDRYLRSLTALDSVEIVEKSYNF